MRVFQLMQFDEILYVEPILKHTSGEALAAGKLEAKSTIWLYLIKISRSFTILCSHELKTIKHISVELTKKIAYHPLFESHLRSGFIVWGGTTAQSLNRILLLRRIAIKIISKLCPRGRCRNFFKDKS